MVIGQVFGKLKAMSLAEPYVSDKGITKIQWECLCECGNVKIVRENALKTGHTKSCGCLHRQKAKENGIASKGINIKSKIGERYGRLKVVKMLENERYKNGSVIWECLCDCGNEVVVSAKHLHNKDGGVKSCGCLCTEKAKISQELAKECDRYKGTKVYQLSRKIQSTNSSGHKGVAWHKKAKKWRARLTLSGKEIHLGLFENIEDAIKARTEAEKVYYKPIIEEFKEINVNKELTCKDAY